MQQWTQQFVKDKKDPTFLVGSASAPSIGALGRGRVCCPALQEHILLYIRDLIPEWVPKGGCISAAGSCPGQRDSILSCPNKKAEAVSQEAVISRDGRMAGTSPKPCRNQSTSISHFDERKTEGFWDIETPMVVETGCFTKKGYQEDSFYPSCRPAIPEESQCFDNESGTELCPQARDTWAPPNTGNWEENRGRPSDKPDMYKQGRISQKCEGMGAALTSDHEMLKCRILRCKAKSSISTLDFRRSDCGQGSSLKKPVGYSPSEKGTGISSQGLPPSCSRPSRAYILLHV